MESLVKELKQAMDEFATGEEQLKKDMNAVLLQFNDRVNALEIKKNRIKELKEAIEPMALADYKENENKKLFGGVGIRESKTITYEVSVAQEWAKEKNMFMVFDAKAFDKSAPTLGLSFVTTGKEPQVTFPKVIKLED